MKPEVRILFELFLAMMSGLVPGKDHTALAQANAEVVYEQPALFKDDPNKVKTAGLVTAVQYRESGLNNEAVGDHGHSVCSMQIYDGPKSFLKDPKACVTRGVTMLLQSVRIDPENPVAFYAAGGAYLRCREDRGASVCLVAKRISADRMSLAKRLLARYAQDR